MMSMHDLFYGASEPVWIVKPEKEESRKADIKSETVGNKKWEGDTADYSVLSSIPYYPYYYPDYVPVPAKKEESSSRPAEKKETRVVMKVPICCEECEELVEFALYRMQGVKAVECDTRQERVTVVATTAAPSDILMECRKVFRKSKMWSN